MSLLQHPLKALDQVEWYLDNQDKELFPGAFLLSAGNLGRQVLEQVLFILAFYSGMPRHKYLKSSGEQRTADTIFKNLQKPDPVSGISYLAQARLTGSRIKKFARYPHSLDKWRRLLNEPSHFRNPAAKPKTQKNDIQEFVKFCRGMFEEIDGFLITAAINEIRTKGFIKAVLSDDADNIPGVEWVAVIRPNQIELGDESFRLRIPKLKIDIIPDSQEVPIRWSKKLVLVQHSSGMELHCQMVTHTGKPIDLTDFHSLLDTFASDPKDRLQLARRMKQLGHPIKFVTTAKRLEEGFDRD